MRDAHPLLTLGASRRHGRRRNGSKNVPAPGPGAAAYSGSKAALTQLARVAALEWGADGIRVNVVHPNAVFDTGIWDATTSSQRGRRATASTSTSTGGTTCSASRSRAVTSRVLVAAVRTHLRRRRRARRSRSTGATSASSEGGGAMTRRNV